MIDFNPLYALAGSAVGVLVGFTGVGGGSLMTPLLVLAFGFHPVAAVGTDLLYAALTKTVGTAVHGWGGTVDWKIVKRLALGSVPATILTLAGLAWFGTDPKDSAKTISFVLGIALILTAVALLFRQQIIARLGPALDKLTDERVHGWTIVLGAVLGFMVTLTSVGAGAIGMTVLLLLYPKVATNRLVGSDIAHAVPLTLIGGIGHWTMGNVDVSLLLSLLAGSVPGIIVGSLLSSRASERVIRPVLAATLLLVGGKLVF